MASEARDTAVAAVPALSATQFQAWVATQQPEDDLYGWVTQLPDGHRQQILQVAAQAYRRFGAHMRWVARVLPQRRNAPAHRKADTSWVTQEDLRVQRVFNRLVRRMSRELGVSIGVIGEEGSVSANGARFVIVRDPIDGTRAFMKPPGQDGADHYTSTLTLLYRDGQKAVHPVLTIVVAPEYRLPDVEQPGLWLVAGLGLDGVRMNGERVTAPMDRPLNQVVGGVGVLGQTVPLNYLYIEALQAHARGIRVYGDAMAMFEVIPSAKFPELAGTYLAGAQPLWDALPTWHLVRAFGGGALSTLDGHPVVLTEELLAEGSAARVPPRFLCVSPRAHQQLVAAYDQYVHAEREAVEQWLRSSQAQQFLLPPPASVSAPMPWRTLVDQEAERILAAYQAHGGLGKYGEGYRGPDLAGHAELAEAIAARLRTLLDAQGRSDVQIVPFNEDWFVVDRLERTRWLAANPRDPRALDHQAWVRWETLHAALDAVWNTDAPLTLTNLYARGDGRTDHQQTLAVGPNTIVLVVGTYILDQALYAERHPGKISHLTVAGTDAWTSFYRHVEQSRRQPEDLRFLYQEVYLPRWLRVVEQIDFSTPQVTAIDLNNREFPRILRYA